MIEKLSTLATKRYRPSLLIWLLVLAFGVWSYTTLLDREGFPPVEVPFATVNGVYFVDDAEQVDQKVINPITDELIDIDEISSISSVARDDSFNMFIGFSSDISSADGADLVRDKVDGLAGDLPEAAQLDVEPISAVLFNNEFNALISVYGDNNGHIEELTEQAELLANQLQAEDNIRRASVEQQFTESVNPITGETEVRQTQFSSYGENVNGAIEVSDAVVVGVVAATGTDDLDLDDAMVNAIEHWQRDNPDTQATVSAGYAEIIRPQLSSLQSNVFIGVIVVIAVAGLLIGWRAAVVIAFFIPTVLAATLIGVFAGGNTLNTIVLFTLVLVLGLIVDNAIVITEALDAAKRTKRRMNKEKLIRDAVKRVGLAMSAGTLTTALVFAPILFVTGILGDFIRILPMTVITALLLSLLIALAFIPFLASVILLRGKQRDRAPLDGVVRMMQSVLLAVPRRVAAASKRMRRASIAFAIVMSFGVFGLGGYLLGQLPFNVFPQSGDADALLLQLSFDSDTDIEQAQELTRQVNEVVSGVLGEDGSFITYPQASAQSAVARIALVPFTDRDTTSQEYIAELESALEQEADVQFTLQQFDAGPPAEAFPFALQILTEDISAGQELADSIAELIETEKITRSDGSVVEVDEVRVAADENVIRRSDSQRFVEVTVAYDATDITGVVTATEAAITDEFDDGRLDEFGFTSDNLVFDFGQESENVESFESVQVAFVLALFLMYLLLVLQFNSFSQPLLILLAVPFGLVGVGASLLIAEHELSFFVMVGLIGLVGIVVNNAILLVDYANQELRSGAKVDEAIISALGQRFRPILTTTLTTVGALSPLALSDPFWEPLALTIIFGLIASSILVLTLFPYFYIVFEQARAAKNKKFPSLK